MAYRTTAHRLDRDQAVRARILDCALQRVAAGGFAALTMQGLAEDAGVATGSLYRHFEGKGALAAEVFSRASQREVEALAQVLQAPGDPAASLAAGIARFAARAWSSRRLAYALIAEPVEPEVDVQRLRYRDAYGALFAALLEEGRASGAFAPGAIAVAAACLVGAIAEALVGPLSPAVRRDGSPNAALAEVTTALVTFCLRAVGARTPDLEIAP
ncbi:TetR/AcrR family transcriptional regulator [Pseudomonas mangiferae]|uniref:TetR/AcrR family transcriptional regulator n=1 Tax=Pseudomonas mangiferae TaxID=2593654 RepID=A0A553GXN6_9PSED|nr:TetR/AcrR family transcriptional regulator [Pseudomonas mangiferae]TRX74264.1 TetR/AcrR family transcriptional regulator [Pseudomonas mangiferae]